MMSETILEKRLAELVNEIESLSADQRKKLIMLARQADNSHKKLSKNIDSLQEAVDMLRVVVKYQCFDLEATRRENTSLKKLIDDTNRQ